MDNIVREVVHASEVRVGDTVEIEGVLRTVCESNIKYSIMGISIFGMTRFPRTGYQKVTRVRFAVPTNNGVVLR